MKNSIQILSKIALHYLQTNSKFSIVQIILQQGSYSRAGICWISDFLRHHGWSFACYIQLTRDCKNKLRNVQMFLCLAVWQFKLFCLIVPLFSLTTQNTKPCMFQYLLYKSPLCGIHTDDIQSNLKLNRWEILTRNFTLQFWICAEYIYYIISKCEFNT